MLLFGVVAKILVWLFAHQQYGVVAGEAPGRGPGVERRPRRNALGRRVRCGLQRDPLRGSAFGDPFALPSFAFRFVLGVVLTLIFVLRGFAAAVWAHALYDIWVLVLP